MAFRSRTSPGRPRFSGGTDPDRRNLYLNLAFGGVVIIAVALLAIAAGVNWYRDHLAPAATVDGETITRDEYRTRLEVDAFRLQLQERRLNTRLRAGTIRESDYNTIISILNQQLQSVETLSLERLIDARIQAKLAAAEGITVGEADIDARFTEEATTPELRRAWMIEVTPETDLDALEPTPEQVAAAKAKADKAARDIAGGQPFEDVARAVSTHGTKDQGGDIGYLDEETSLDAGFVAALFALEANGVTAVLEGADGVFRIGRVTEIVPESVDQGLAQVVSDEGIELAAFRESLRADVLREKLDAVIVERAIQSGPQRHVREIFLEASANEAEPGAVRVRHILYSPGDDPSAAATLPADDPAWGEAEAEAKAALAKLREDPSLFGSIAREESDDEQSGAAGGDLGYWLRDGSLTKAFEDAMFAPDLEPGQILDIVKTEFGFHIIQFLGAGPNSAVATSIRDRVAAGASFAELAETYSSGDEAADGGDLGFIAKIQFPDVLSNAIFAAPIGQVSEPVVVTDSGTDLVAAGVYLYLVVTEEVRAPEGEQLEDLKSTAFGTWYAQRKATVTITRDVLADLV